MASIEPFAALRYAPDLRPSLSQLLTPPYDVISRNLQRELYDRHGNNLVRIDLGKEEAESRARFEKEIAATRQRVRESRPERSPDMDDLFTAGFSLDRAITVYEAIKNNPDVTPE